jgi:hypothetical protein
LHVKPFQHISLRIEEKREKVIFGMNRSIHRFCYGEEQISAAEPNRTDPEPWQAGRSMLEYK